jgi:hypothetical protein
MIYDVEEDVTVVSRAVGATRSVPGHLRKAGVQQAFELDTIEADGMTTFRIVVPYAVPSKNEWDGWKPEWKAGTKKRWMRAIAARVAEMNVPLHCERVGLAVEIVFGVKASRRDPQNYAQFVWNVVPDALVAAEVLVDDNEGRIQTPPNFGVKLSVDTRVAPKAVKQRAIIALTVEHAKPKEA